MPKTMITLMAACALALTAPAQQTGTKDDFAREGRPEQRARKDLLEGKRPPPLQVNGWMNVRRKGGLRLGDLRGKVVLLKFWGVW